MNKRDLIPIVGIGLLVAALVLAVYSAAATPGSVTNVLPSKFTVNGKTFAITYVASTESEREHGLMNTSVTNATFELFAWPNPGTYSFWMYQTNTSLDMIWINESSGAGTVVYVVNAAPSCYNSAACAVYTPTSAANYVIEAKAGFAQLHSISKGTSIQFS